MTIDTDHFKALLIKRREEMLATANVGKESAKPVELDQTTVGRLSRMDAMQMQAMALATENRRQQELQRIESALERIKSDDYGYCMRCDEEIAPKRLEFDPTALVCVQCASGSKD